MAASMKSFSSIRAALLKGRKYHSAQSPSEHMNGEDRAWRGPRIFRGIVTYAPWSHSIRPYLSKFSTLLSFLAGCAISVVRRDFSQCDNHLERAPQRTRCRDLLSLGWFEEPDPWSAVQWIYHAYLLKPTTPLLFVVATTTRKLYNLAEEEKARQGKTSSAAIANPAVGTCFLTSFNLGQGFVRQ
ncbi:hypothetical protein CDAR_381911 [Caerostris darwini]|uniref:Uncharacterized protein n=1 Tax=Caerostris darwini TaxID=1538125 RepID=A0AAV4V5Q9_9ARAC|nr:hypothetical protein CDAR_381911 [Caerostris darwini]